MACHILAALFWVHTFYCTCEEPTLRHCSLFSAGHASKLVRQGTPFAPQILHAQAALKKHGHQRRLGCTDPLADGSHWIVIGNRITAVLASSFSIVAIFGRSAGGRSKLPLLINLLLIWTNERTMGHWFGRLWALMGGCGVKGNPPYQFVPSFKPVLELGSSMCHPDCTSVFTS